VLYPAAERRGAGLLVYAVPQVKNKLYASYYPLIVALDTKNHYFVCLCNVRNGIKISRKWFNTQRMLINMQKLGAIVLIRKLIRLPRSILSCLLNPKCYSVIHEVVLADKTKCFNYIVVQHNGNVLLLQYFCEMVTINKSNLFIFLFKEMFKIHIYIELILWEAQTLSRMSLPFFF